MSVHFERINPRDHADAIKTLFVAHGRAEIPEAFDRMYTPESGVSSWVGVDTEGAVVLHVACFPHRFLYGDQVVVGGLVVNWMAAEQHRTVFPALSLIRKLVKDIRNDTSFDFIYAVPNAAAAPVVKMAGFKDLATVQRYVLPISRGGLVVDLSLSLRLLWARLRNRTRYSMASTLLDAAGFPVDKFEHPAAGLDRLVPFRPLGLLHRRLKGYPAERDRWVVLSDRKHPGQTRAVVLVRGPDDAGMARVCSIWRQPNITPTTILLQIAARLRRLGVRSLNMRTIRKCDFAQEACRAGFVERGESTPVALLPLTELGKRAANNLVAWEVMGMDCNR